MRDVIEGILRGAGRLFGWWAESMTGPEDDYYRLRFPNGDVFKFRTWFLSFLPSGATFRYMDRRLYFVLFSVNIVEFLEKRRKVVEVVGWEADVEVNVEDERDVEEVSERIVHPVLGTLSMNASLVYHLPLITCPTRDALLELIKSLADAYSPFPQYRDIERFFSGNGIPPFVNEVFFYKSNPYWEWGGERMEFTPAWREHTTRLVRTLIQGNPELSGFDGYEVRNLGLRKVFAPDRIKLKSRFFEDMAKFVNEKNEEFLSYVEEKKKTFPLYPNGTYFLSFGAENVEEFVLALFYNHRLAEKFLFPLSRWERVLTQ